MCFAPQRRAMFHLSSGQLAPHRGFSEPTFRPSGATNHCKNVVFRDFPTFSRTWTFFLLTLSLCSSLLFSDSSHLCFSSVHIVGSLTFKLPSITIIHIHVLFRYIRRNAITFIYTCYSRSYLQVWTGSTIYSW